MATTRIRRGVIFYVTLVVVLMAGLLAASLNYYIRSQVSGEYADRNAAQAQESARAGVAFAVAVLLDETRAEEDFTDNPELFRAIPVTMGQIEWRVSLMRDVAEDDAAPAYGVADESGKLNLNAIGVDQLLLLPGMTPEIAEAIMDWRDADTQPRPQGAEDEYYEQLDNPYNPKNGPFESVDELLLVRGVTERLLYGEDLNRNGLLDPNEDDGDESLPPDNGDGKLDRGWYPHLTVYSIDWGVTSDGQRPININSGNADNIRNQMIERGFSEALADFIRDARAGNVRFKHPSELLGWSGKIGNNEVSAPPLDLEELGKAVDQLSTSRSRFALGRVNPAAASSIVLQAIAFTEAEAEAAISARANLSAQDKRTYAWLADGVLSQERFKALAPALIGRGQQYRIDAVGFSPQLGLFHRIETVVDIARGRARTLYLRDLTGLGPAYVLTVDETEGTIRAGR